MNASPETAAAAFAFDTERLLIRPLARADEALYCGVYTDAETMRFIGPPLTWEHAARSFQIALRMNARQPMKHLFLTLIDKESLRSVGMCSVQGIDVSQRRAEAGIIILSPARARGFGAEGLTAVVKRAFCVLSIDEVWMQTAAGHAGIERVALRVGFAPMGLAEAMHGRAPQRLWSTYRQESAGDQTPY